MRGYLLIKEEDTGLELFAGGYGVVDAEFKFAQAARDLAWWCDWLQLVKERVISVRDGISVLFMPIDRGIVAAWPHEFGILWDGKRTREGDRALFSCAAQHAGFFRKAKAAELNKLA